MKELLSSMIIYAAYTALSPITANLTESCAEEFPGIVRAGIKKELMQTNIS